MCAILLHIVKSLPWRRAVIPPLIVLVAVSLASGGAGPSTVISFSACVSLLDKLQKDPNSSREDWTRAIQSFVSINKTEKNRIVARKSLFFAGRAALELYSRSGKAEDLTCAVRCLTEFTRDHRKDQYFIEGLKALKEADTLKKKRLQSGQDRPSLPPAGPDFAKTSTVRVPQNSERTSQEPQQPTAAVASQPAVGGNWNSPAYRHVGNPFWTPRNRNRWPDSVPPSSPINPPTITETSDSTSVSVTAPASQAVNRTLDCTPTAVSALPPHLQSSAQLSPPQPIQREPAKDAPATPVQTKFASAAPPAKPAQELEKKQNCAAKSYVVVLDPGHGGKDPGAVSQDGTLREKDITLEVAKATKRILEKNNPEIRVELTRTEDKFMRLEARTGFANRLNADLFISVHCNSDSDSSSAGVETYYLSQATSEKAMKVAATENNLSLAKMTDLQATLLDLMVSSKKTESEELATAVSNSLEQAIPKGRHRGVKQAPFYVLLGAKMPAILVECAFISSSRESKRLHNAGYLNTIAQGLANGAHSYIQGLGTSGENLAQGAGLTAKASK